MTPEDIKALRDMMTETVAPLTERLDKIDAAKETEAAEAAAAEEQRTNDELKTELEEAKRKLAESEAARTAVPTSGVADPAGDTPVVRQEFVTFSPAERELSLRMNCPVPEQVDVSGLFLKQRQV